MKANHSLFALPTRFVLVFSLVFAWFLSFPNSASADPPIRHAAPVGQGLADCSSWADACPLQTALTGAASGDEVWVKAGVYKPTEDPSNRGASFQVQNGVAVYGGFSGDETSRAERDWQVNLTILSGDIDSNDTNLDGNFIAETVSAIQGGNSYHVVQISSAASSSVLDGFVVTAGQAPSDGLAGGVYNYFSSPTLANLLIIGNSAGYAAGMHNNQSSPTLSNIVFMNNSASSDAGGLLNYYGCDVTMTNVAFIGNTAVGGGGAMHNYMCTVRVHNGLFLGNHAAGSGAISSNQSNITLKGVTFYGNTATGQAGGIGVYFSSLTLRNVIMWGDQAAENNEIRNVPDKYGDPSSGINIAYSDVQGCGGSSAWVGSAHCGTNGGGNIDSDPLFLDPTNGNLRLGLTSPAIDAGRNSDVPDGLTIDLDGLPRFVDIATVTDTGAGTPPIVDMGPYEAHVDETAPAVVSITRLDPSPTNRAVVRFLVAFSEPVSGVSPADFELTASGLSGAAVTGVSGGPASYQVFVSTGAGSGALRLDIPAAASVLDLALNPLTGLPFTSGESYTIDKTAPTVVSITRLGPSPTDQSSVDFKVTFSEAVTGVDVSDFGLDLSGTLSGAAVSGVIDTGDHIVYTVSVDTGAGGGALRLDVPAVAAVADQVGNPLDGLPFTSGEAYVIQGIKIYLPTIKRD